jgi:hypothetical protein
LKREKALFISRKENLKYLTDEFQRVYYGDEFCDRLIPFEKELKEVMSEVKEKGLSFTFVTPYVTEAGLKKLIKLFSVLPEKTEVVVNDWGAFRVIKERFSDLAPVLGRLMIKLKRGPRIAGFLASLPKESVDHLKRTNLGVPVYSKFLTENNIFRAEIDNPLQGFDLSDVPKEIKLSLYIPFAYVTTTRFCLTANCDDADKKGVIGVFPCGKECRKYTFYLDNPVMNKMLIRRGNTIFYQNTQIPEKINNFNIDRIVVQPEVPH